MTVNVRLLPPSTGCVLLNVRSSSSASTTRQVKLGGWKQELGCGAPGGGVGDGGGAQLGHISKIHQKQDSKNS